MKKINIITLMIVLAIVSTLAHSKSRSILPFLIPVVFAHCDTLSGPVIKDAKTALEKKDVTAVLKWVKKEKEDEIKAAFNKALKERAEGNPEKADMRFFETLVRIHREGEGAPFTGLKSAETELEPAVEEADKSLETASVDRLLNLITGHVEHGIRERFEKVIEAKKHMNESVEAGREYVEAYVEFVHYVEGLDLKAKAKGSEHEESEHK